MSEQQTLRVEMHTDHGGQVKILTVTCQCGEEFEVIEDGDGADLIKHLRDTME